jgi:hypothetical protein
MEYVVGIPVLVFLLALVYGGVTGRVRLSSCCAVADPRRDLRMRGAFEDLEQEQPSTRRSSEDVVR